MPSAELDMQRISFSVEIRQMMYSFGDSPCPQKESVELVEKIVLEQLSLIMNLATESAITRNAKSIGLEDFVFLLRHSPVKLRRFCRYLEVLDMKRNLAKASSVTREDSELGDLGLPSTTTGSKWLQTSLTYLKTIDPSGHLQRIADPYNDDPSLDKQIKERESRIDKMTQEMDLRQYMEFSRVRQTSFMKKNTSAKFREWVQEFVTLPELKISSLAWEILSYLAHETVAQIIDLCLLVRRDTLAVHAADDLQRNVVPHSVLQTAASPQFVWSNSVKPVQVSEIREAILRFSTQNSAVAHFTRNYAVPLRSRILAL